MSLLNITEEMVLALKQKIDDPPHCRAWCNARDANMGFTYGFSKDDGKCWCKRLDHSVSFKERVSQGPIEYVKNFHQFVLFFSRDTFLVVTSAPIVSIGHVHVIVGTLLFCKIFVMQLSFCIFCLKLSHLCENKYFHFFQENCYEPSYRTS